MELTAREQDQILAIVKTIRQLNKYLSTTSLSETDTVEYIYRFLANYRRSQGNINNAVSFAGLLLAKKYLSTKFEMDFDCAAKPQGAAGLDIDVRTSRKLRIIGELKTTEPYQSNDLGANQRVSFLRDFEKLNTTPADHKYFFVCDEFTFSLMKSKYARKIPGVVVVNLTSGEEFSIALSAHA